MKHLVTGNAGFIGSHLADALSERGVIVCGIDDMSGGSERNVSGRVRQGIHPLHERPPRGGFAAKWFTNAEPFACDVLWHLAADATEGRSQFTPTSAVHNNVNAYLDTLTACIRAWKDAGDIERRKVVLFSSIAVYGAQEPPFSEDMHRLPVDVYGAAKAFMEQMTEALADVHGFRYTILRPHNVFGPRQRLDDPYRNVVGIFMNKAMRGEPVIIYGDGEQRRAFSYIENSLPCYLRCADADTDGEIYNVGGMRELSVNDLWDVVGETMREHGYSTPPIERVPDRPREVKEAYATYEKSIALGYDDRIGIVEGVERMAFWAAKQGPQDWRYSPLELDSDKAPAHWRNV